MDRVAVFVDAGYLFAQGSVLIAGTKLKRSDTRLDYDKVIEFFRNPATTTTNLPLLRVYWYDGTDSGPTAVHSALASRSDVKVRLGIVNAHGEQKGVDSLIVSDLMDLSRNRAMCDAVVLTGDEDMRVGVQKAQEVGVRVHLLGLAPAQQNQSLLLRQEADTVRELTKAEVQTFLTQFNPPTQVFQVPASANTLAAAAKHFAAMLPKTDIDRVSKSSAGVPPDIDSGLLKAGAQVVQGSVLSTDQKRELRKAFVAACKNAP